MAMKAAAKPTAATPRLKSASSLDTSVVYWVVSPNVKNKPKTVPEWKQASIQYWAAFMGY
jgi:hypothetical protein